MLEPTPEDFDLALSIVAHAQMGHEHLTDVEMPRGLATYCSCFKFQ
jgi:hypothetical protein